MKYPSRPLHHLMDWATGGETSHPDRVEDTFKFLARVMENEPEAHERRYIQGFMSRLLAFKAMVKGEGVILRG